MAVTKAMLRDAAAAVLKRRGYCVEGVTGRGIKAGAKLCLTSDGGQVLAHVKATQERLVSATRRPGTGEWRYTQRGADEHEPLVIVAAPLRKDADTIEVFAFASARLAQRFDEALVEMRRNGRDPSSEMPVFVPLDERTRKDTGHGIVGLQKDALWAETITVGELAHLASGDGIETASNGADASVNSMKAAFAKLNNVDAADVIIEINFRVRGTDGAGAGIK